VIGEEAEHLQLALQPVSLAIELVALRLIDGCVRADAEERVVGVGFVGHREVTVVGGDDRDAELAADVRDHRVQAGELFVVVVLDFEVVVAVEDFAIPLRDGDGALAVAFLDAAMEFGRRAAAEDRDPGAVRFEELAVDARLVVIALQVRLCDERDEVPVSLEVPGEHDEVVRLVVAPLARMPAALGDVGFDADDGLDAPAAGFAVEIHGAVEGTVVGHRDRVHAELLHAVHERRDFRHAVEQRVLGMSV
jgi:hypothetical protein